MQGAALALVVGTLDHERVAVLADGDAAGDRRWESSPLGPLTVTDAAGDGDVDAGRAR